MSENWYVVQTQLKQEMRAKVNLQLQGFEVFLPLYRKPFKKGSMLLPLFSSYIFVKFDANACRWQSIHSTKGISRILGYDSGSNMITPCRDDAVPTLRSFAGEDGIIDMDAAFPSSGPEYSQGDTIKILDGVFKGQTATYWNNTKSGNMVILSLLNRPVRVIIKNELISKG